MSSVDLEAYLARTVQLCRDIVSEGTPDMRIVDALRSTVVCIASDARTVTGDAAQSAIVTLAILVMRMGCDVRLAFPETKLAAAQPPIRGRMLREGIVELSTDLIPGVTASRGTPTAGDIVFIVGPGGQTHHTHESWQLAWSSGGGAITSMPVGRPSTPPNGAIGALVAATLAAAEVFKAAMRKLPLRDREQLAAATEASVDLAADDGQGATPIDLGTVDCVSAGALGQSFAYSLLRIRSAIGRVRFFDPERVDRTNLNRYPLSRCSDVGIIKTSILERNAAGLRFLGVPERFDEEHVAVLSPLAPTIIVGTDDIPSRWLAQAAKPDGWIAVGATDHFLAMSSEHAPGLGCVRCLHDRDDGVVATIPTVSFVSFWGGLMLAARLLRRARGEAMTAGHQVDLLWTLQLGSAHGRQRHGVVCRACRAAA